MNTTEELGDLGLNLVFQIFYALNEDTNLAASVSAQALDGVAETETAVLCMTKVCTSSEASSGGSGSASGSVGVPGWCLRECAIAP